VSPLQILAAIAIIAGFVLAYFYIVRLARPTLKD